jgi:hypothetical protein
MNCGANYRSTRVCHAFLISNFRLLQEKPIAILRAASESTPIDNNQLAIGTYNYFPVLPGFNLIATPE